jgi:hypothetical protein
MVGQKIVPVLAILYYYPWCHGLSNWRMSLCFKHKISTSLGWAACRDDYFLLLCSPALQTDMQMTHGYDCPLQEYPLRRRRHVGRPAVQGEEGGETEYELCRPVHGSSDVLLTTLVALSEVDALFVVNNCICKIIC